MHIARDSFDTRFFVDLNHQQMPHLGHDRDKRSTTALSGGEQQRVAIARALANHPSVIIADEPTGNLDSETAQEVMGTLNRLRTTAGVTIVIATHDEEVARLTDRRIRIRDGTIRDAKDGR